MFRPLYLWQGTIVIGVIVGIVVDSAAVLPAISSAVASTSESSWTLTILSIIIKFGILALLAAWGFWLLKRQRQIIPFYEEALAARKSALIAEKKANKALEDAQLYLQAQQLQVAGLKTVTDLLKAEREEEAKNGEA